MPIWMMAGVWGFVTGLALLLGTAAGYCLKISHRVVATIMAFGNGVLILALSFDRLQGRRSVRWRSLPFSSRISLRASRVPLECAKPADQSALSSARGEGLRSSAASLPSSAIPSGRFSADAVAATTVVAAGAILAMLADTMLPEAFENAHNFAGLITVAGFLVAFVLTKLTENKEHRPWQKRLLIS